MSVTLIIAAGGSGKRFLKGEKRRRGPRKLFLNVGGKPLLSHALESFRDLPQIREIFLVIPPGTETWVGAHILKGFPRKPPVRLVPGGKTRAESVWNALRRSSPRHGWILVHDGARPFPPRKAVLELLRKKNQADGVILARPVIPTLKRVALGNGRVLETVDRTGLFEAETPQLVRRSTLLKAYRENPKALWETDESSLAESVGGRVKVLPHSDWNVKITTPGDFRLAEAYWAQKSPLSVTMGLGRDTHRLVPGRRFYLGGVRIPFEKGTLGHSDGDALLHAVSDAILGALSLGDLGDWFPPDDPRYKNIRSEKFVKRILNEVKSRGWQPERVDTVIILERPKLGPYKKKIQKEVARIVGIPAESVSIKAKTQEGLGPEGEGRAVTCEALVLLRRSPS